jgi:hypothetical protein
MDAYRPEEGKPADQVAQDLRGLRGHANVFSKAAGTGAGLTALLWGANVIDALLDGLAAE